MFKNLWYLHFHSYTTQAKMVRSLLQQEHSNEVQYPQRIFIHMLLFWSQLIINMD